MEVNKVGIDVGGTIVRLLTCAQKKRNMVDITCYMGSHKKDTDDVT